MSVISDIKQQLALLDPQAKDLRNLGLIFGLVGLIISGIMWYKDSPNLLWPLVIGLFFAVWGLAWPAGLKPVYRVWMTIAATLGYFMSRLLLSIVFFLLFTPIGLVMRLLGKDIIGMKMGSQESYWQLRTESGYKSVQTEKMY